MVYLLLCLDQGTEEPTNELAETNPLILLNTGAIPEEPDLIQDHSHPGLLERPEIPDEQQYLDNDVDSGDEKWTVIFPTVQQSTYVISQASICNASDGDTWIFDSGASHNFCSNRSLFV